MTPVNENPSRTMPPALLLGASGRLGRLLQGYWMDQPVTFQSRSGSANTPGFDVLTQPEMLISACRGQSAILCFAGITYGKGPLSANTDIALAVVRAAAMAGRVPVLLSSSAAVYGNDSKRWRETDEPEPVSEYGREKLRMEQEAQRLGQDLGVPVCSLRIANVAGADAILAGWKPGFQLDAWDQGTTPLRSYISLRQLASVLADLVRQADQLPEVLNICTPEPIRMGDLLNAAQLRWTSRVAAPGCIASVVLDSTLLETYHAFAPSLDPAADIIADWRQSRGG